MTILNPKTIFLLSVALFNYFQSIYTTFLYNYKKKTRHAATKKKKPLQLKCKKIGSYYPKVINIFTWWLAITLSLCIAHFELNSLFSPTKRPTRKERIIPRPQFAVAIQKFNHEPRMATGNGRRSALMPETDCTGGQPALLPAFIRYLMETHYLDLWDLRFVHFATLRCRLGLLFSSKNRIQRAFYVLYVATKRTASPRAPYCAKTLIRVYRSRVKSILNIY